MVDDKRISLKDIDIKSFKDINWCQIKDLPENAPWIFLTGENGVGKTVFLQAIALGLHPIHPDINSYLEFIKHSGSISIKTYGGETYGIKSNQEDVKFINNSNMVWLSSYGPSRLQVLTETDQNERVGYSPGVNRLFGKHTFLKNIDFELVKWKLKAGFKDDLQKTKEAFKRRIYFVEQLFKEMLDIVALEIDLDKDLVWYFEKGTDDSTLTKVNRNDLGAGYRYLIGLVGDLILNLSINQPDVFNPSDLKGIVLIDELELHLHPKWQKSLPSILSKHFPKIQFIASTHSPLTILGAPKNSVVLKVDRSSENGIEVKRLKKIEKDIEFLLPNAVYSSDIFGFSEFTLKGSVEIDRIYYEDVYKDIEENNKVRERLEKLKDPKAFPEDLFDKE